jgi:hypothetical protein
MTGSMTQEKLALLHVRDAIFEDQLTTALRCRCRAQEIYVGIAWHRLLNDVGSGNCPG